MLRTEADGSRTTLTLGALGITSIGLVENMKSTTFEDGLKITGVTDFVINDVQRTAAAAASANEAAGFSLSRRRCSVARVRTRGFVQRQIGLAA